MVNKKEHVLNCYCYNIELNTKCWTENFIQYGLGIPCYMMRTLFTFQLSFIILKRKKKILYNTLQRLHYCVAHAG